MRYSVTALFTNLILLFSSYFLSAQESVKNVDVHFNDGKVITGDVFFYDYTSSRFRLAASTTKTYRISEIQYFENSDILVRRRTFQGEDKLFIAIVEGEKMSLYKTEMLEKSIFYVSKDDKVYKLEGEEIEIEKDGRRYLKEDDRYKGTLRYLMDSDPILLKKIKTLKYREKDLAELIISFNEGRVSYVNYEAIASHKKKALFFYLQYTNEPNYSIFSDLNSSPALWGMGAKLKFDENSRHALRLGFEYGKYTNELHEIENHSRISLAFVYLYDFYRLPHFNTYFNFRMIDISYTMGTEKNYVYLFPRLSPGIGFEYYFRKKIIVYAELNHLAVTRNLPYNFSVGLAYKL